MLDKVAVSRAVTKLIKAGRIDLHTFVRALSTNPAQVFGLTNKGSIRVGADADIVIFDPEHTRTLSSTTHQSQVDYNAFEGWEVSGRAETVTVRGRIMVRDGEFNGDTSHGQQIRREPNH